MDRRGFLATAGGALAAAALVSSHAGADELPLGPLPGTRYPDPRVEVLDPKFKYRIGNTAIERIATGFRWAEGPVYIRDGGYLLWSDIPNNRIMRWSEDDGHLSVFRYPSNYSNGNTRDREGRLITCEHDSRRVTRTEHDGTITVLMDNYNGKKLNAPNDVVVSADGAYAHGRGDHGHSRKGNARPTETVRIVNTIHPIIVGKGHHRHDGDDRKHRYPYPGRVPIGGPLPPQPAPVGMPKPPPPAPPAPPAPSLPAQTAPAPMPPAPSGGLTPGGGRDPGRPPTRAQ